MANLRSLHNFTQTQLVDWNILDLCSKINRLSNKSNHISVLSIKSDNHFITNNTEIVNKFAKTWTKYSKDDNFPQKFRHYKPCCQNLNSTFAFTTKENTW